MIEKPWHRHYDYNVPTTIRYPRLAAHELLDLPSGAYPDKAALIFFGSEMTFYELRQESRRFCPMLWPALVSRRETGWEYTYPIALNI